MKANQLGSGKSDFFNTLKKNLGVENSETEYGLFKKDQKKLKVKKSMIDDELYKSYDNIEQ